jgi:hypothetical protein
LKLRISLQNNTKRRGKNEVTESLRYSSFFPHLSVLSLQNLPTENLSKQLVNKIGGIDIIQNQNKTKQGEKKNRKRKRFHERSQSSKQKEEEDSWKNQLPITGSTLRQTLRNGLVSISPSGDFTVFIVSKAGPKTVVVVVAMAKGGRGRQRGENREIK